MLTFGKVKFSIFFQVMYLEGKEKDGEALIQNSLRILEVCHLDLSFTLYIFDWKFCILFYSISCVGRRFRAVSYLC